ncbi:MAG: hypothetical protein E7E29_20390, partial [Pseudomonas aeruginosa]|nr:hypothetical protein [Pseudomonas aeruginosa]
EELLYGGRVMLEDGLFDQFLRQAPPSSALYTCAKLALYPLIAYMIAKMRLRSRLDLSPI